MAWRLSFVIIAISNRYTDIARIRKYSTTGTNYTKNWPTAYSIKNMVLGHNGVPNLRAIRIRVTGLSCSGQFGGGSYWHIDTNWWVNKSLFIVQCAQSYHSDSYRIKERTIYQSRSCLSHVAFACNVVITISFSRWYCSWDWCWFWELLNKCITGNAICSLSHIARWSRKLQRINYTESRGCKLVIGF